MTRRRSSTRPGGCGRRTAHLVDALALRVSGLAGLADAFKQTASSKATTEAPTRPRCSPRRRSRLVASDIVWDDLFRALARAQLAERRRRAA